MDVVTSVADVQQRRALWHTQSKTMTIGLVPTMGALHAGHLSLIHEAKQRCERVVATIFVNPTQFGPNEDFAKYPRTLDADKHLLEEAGVDLLFAPSVDVMYPDGAVTFVDVPEVGSRLDGASRPGHFRGVATIVSKLFLVVQPDEAFFGQKDAAQVAVIRTFTKDLLFPVKVVACPIVRDADRLALSSRNRYLNHEERRQALALYASLRTIQRSMQHGEQDVARLRTMLHDSMVAAEGVRLDYAEIVSPQSLLPLTILEEENLVAVAAWVGSTRLIDNLLLNQKGEVVTP